MATTTIPVTACRKACDILLEAAAYVWVTDFEKIVVATQIVFIENGTNNTSTSINYQTSISYDGTIINGTAVTTFTENLYDTRSPHTLTASRTILL